MSIGLYIVLAPLYLKSVRKLQEKRFVFVKILAIIIPENGAKVSKIKCFQFAQQTLIMDDEARKRLLTEWQNRKKETITHPFLKEKIEWGMVPYVQAMLLARYLRGDLDGYPVFLWK